MQLKQEYNFIKQIAINYVFSNYIYNMIYKHNSPVTSSVPNNQKIEPIVDSDIISLLLL